MLRAKSEYFIRLQLIHISTYYLEFMKKMSFQETRPVSMTQIMNLDRRIAPKIRLTMQMLKAQFVN